MPGTEGELGATHTVSFSGSKESFTAREREVVIPSGAEVLAVYRGDNLEGQLAVTLHPAGRGFIVFVSFNCHDSTFFDALFALIARRFAISPLLAAPRDVDVVSRTVGKTNYIFLINDARKAVEIVLPQQYSELLTGRTVSGQFNLDALQVAILERLQSDITGSVSNG